MNFQTMYAGDSQSYTTAGSCKSAVDIPLTQTPTARYPNSYIDDIHPVDIQRHTSNDVRATLYVPQNVTHTRYESSGGVRHREPHDDSTVNGALRDALDDLARTRNTLDISDDHRKTLGRANKELLDQVQAVRVELHAEKQKYTNLQNELASTTHLKRQAETQLEHHKSKCARVAKELEEEKAINANLGAETNALYERYVSMQEMAVVATARNKELEAQLATLYGTPKERLERAEREKEEMEYKIILEKELKYSAKYQKVLEDENGRLRAAVHSLENQLRAGTAYVKQEDQLKKLFIKNEEGD